MPQCSDKAAAGEALLEPRHHLMNINKPKYDLEERTAVFGVTIIRFAGTIPENSVTRPLLSQLVRSSTSVGANYCEADDAESKKDFRHKIGICRKEAREAKHWLRMLVATVPEVKADARVFWQEAKELNLIFSAIIRSTDTGS